MNFELFIIQVLAHGLITVPLVGSAIALAIHLVTEVRASRERGWDRRQGLQTPATREAAPELLWFAQCAPTRRNAAPAAPVRAPAPASTPRRLLHQAIQRALLRAVAFVLERGGHRAARWGSRPIARVRASRSGEPARSQARRYLSITWSAARRCVPSAPGLIR